MTFLKKLGQVLAKGLGIGLQLAGILPIVQPLFGSSKAGQAIVTGVNDFTQIAQMVVTIETAMQGQPGTAKMSAVIPLVSNIIKTSEVVAGKKIADEATFTKGCQEVAQGVVDILNGLHGDNVQGA